MIDPRDSATSLVHEGRAGDFRCVRESWPRRHQWPPAHWLHGTRSMVCCIEQARTRTSWMNEAAIVAASPTPFEGAASVATRGFRDGPKRSIPHCRANPDNGVGIDVPPGSARIASCTILNRLAEVREVGSVRHYQPSSDPLSVAPIMHCGGVRVSRGAPVREPIALPSSTSRIASLSPFLTSSRRQCAANAVAVRDASRTSEAHVGIAVSSHGSISAPISER
jgi:hypothetical protein